MGKSKKYIKSEYENELAELNKMLSSKEEEILYEVEELTNEVEELTNEDICKDEELIKRLEECFPGELIMQGILFEIIKSRRNLVNISDKPLNVGKGYTYH